jgi:hypothetical protein
MSTFLAEANSMLIMSESEHKRALDAMAEHALHQPAAVDWQWYWKEDDHKIAGPDKFIRY